MLIFLCRTDLVIAIGASFIMAMISFSFCFCFCFCFCILIRMPFILMLRFVTMLAMCVARIGHSWTTAKKQSAKHKCHA